MMANENGERKLARNAGEMEGNDENKLRVLTLNCWGIPHISTLKKQRFHDIGQELRKGHYDIVSLQEVWDKTDYESLRVVVETVLPYSYYFYGGVLGTGVCIFSRHPILDTFTFPFTLSGYPYAVAHGDWFGGKAACFALIEHPKMNIHFFTSHLHAEYDRSNDVYLAHRTTQAYHLAKLINQFTTPEDFVILCGDMNSEPVDPCYRIIKQLPQFTDCWAERGVKNENVGNTCDRSENTFTTAKYQDHQIGGPEDGKRIDYIFYRSLDQRWRCDKADVVMGRVPGEKYSFSDHDGVAAVFKMTGETISNYETHGQSPCRPVLTEALAIIRNELRAIDSNFSTKLLFIVLLIFFILYPLLLPAEPDSVFAIGGFLGKVVYFSRILLTIFLCGFIWLLSMSRWHERHAYENVIREIDLQLTHGRWSSARRQIDRRT